MSGGTVLNAFGSQNKFQAKPPEKGSFPIDHEGECKVFMRSFMKCLQANNNDNSKCRSQSKDYLSCRMDKNLMERETWKKLGYADLVKDGT
ncbi:cytochrome c oxidase assembly protein COX19-like isoform X1 [Mercenaria mercenaria]|uniref:cytochrome c oxidase assembly protein COX19-like isoform X1 n=1 Tax=Mercenaria mercenaria TaxID=6596 RepID=UPI00234F8CC0|nr:cytochrome c oxidase assembly protein COX19-like isoform X1 [Mercenaria mercenaria]